MAQQELHTALVDSLGYMKNRNEFETEYENDAELLIRDIIFEDDDEPQDRGIYTFIHLYIFLCNRFD